MTVSISTHRTVERHLRLAVRCLCLIVLPVSTVIPPYLPEASSALEESVHLTDEQFLLVEDGFVMKTASISEQGYRRAYTSGILHTVGTGESLLGIAEFYGIAVTTILWANRLEEGVVLHPRQTLLILPVDGVLHSVRRGQTLSKIASLYSVNVEDILRQNQLKTTRIVEGQQLIIPGGRPLLASRPSSPPSRVGGVGRPRPTPAPFAEAPPSLGVFQKPCDCTYTQHYRPGHYGVDMARPGGGPIFAAEGGTVIRADYGWNGGYGNVVEVDHGNGLVTLYAHNKELHVRVGGEVRRGEVIAQMGRTGKVYGITGVHVHFEVILKGVKKNPLLYLK